MLLSTLDDYVRALGGRLELNVEFPGRKRLVLKTLQEPKNQESKNNGEAVT